MSKPETADTVEETKTPELEEKASKPHEPSQNSPRFKQVYKDNKTNLRKLEEKELRIGEKDLQIEQMLMDSRRMQEKLDKLEKFAGEYQADKTTQKLDTISGQMRKAVELGDTDSFDKLETTYRKAQSSTPSSSTPQTPDDKDMDIFQQYNPWYNTDQYKTNLANQINSEMLKDPNWTDTAKVNNAQFLAEVAKRTNASYVPSVPDMGYQSEGVGNEQSSPAEEYSSNNVELTRTQQQVAEGLFPQLSKEEAWGKYKKHV
jgi:hypothetical protein